MGRELYRPPAWEWEKTVRGSLARGQECPRHNR
jgi:hypothetical protein